MYNIFQLVRPRSKRYFSVANSIQANKRKTKRETNEERIKARERRGKRNYRTDRLALSYSWLSRGSRLRYTAVYPLSLYLLPFFLLALSTNHRSFFGSTCHLLLGTVLFLSRFVTYMYTRINAQSVTPPPKSIWTELAENEVNLKNH